MKTTISVLAVLIFTVLLGFTFAPENSSASVTKEKSCCISGLAPHGAIINAYYNGAYVTQTTALSDGTFTICIPDTMPIVNLTCYINGAVAGVRKGIPRCASGITFTSQDN